jgi:hypothetical protein
MTSSDGRGRARRQVPFPQRSGSGQGQLGPSYTAVIWSCDRCGATVTDTDGHNRFHAALVALWERVR